MPSDAYKAAFLGLSVGILVAKADGVTTAEERAALYDLATVAPGLSAAERRRLAANAHWLQASPMELSFLRSRLAYLGPDARRTVGDALVQVASGDGLHRRAEVSLLEKAFRHLGLDPHRLYASLHAAAPADEREQPYAGSHAGADDEPVRVRVEVTNERTFAIPGRRPMPPATVAPPAAAANRRQADPPADRARAPDRVDGDRLTAIRAETAAISSVLAGVFDIGPEIPVDAGPTAGAEAAVEPGDDASFEGLDTRHDQLLRELAARPAWSRAEFERLAREFGLMPGAALEEINAWAYDRFEDVLVEEGDPVHVNQHLLPGTVAEAA